MAGYRPLYTVSEDRSILRYILDGEYIAQVMGNTLWKQMVNDNICPDRTWQSMKNRFRRHIMPFVASPEYNLQSYEIELIKAMAKPDSVDVCETCHRSRKNKSANPVSNDIDCGSTDEDAPSTSNRKTKTVAQTRKKQETRNNKTAGKSAASFFSLDMTDSSETE